MDIDTSNDSMIAYDGEIISSVLHLRIKTRQQAFRAASYIVLMGEVLPNEDKDYSFEDVLNAIASK